MRINAVKLGLAGGILWGLFLLLTTLISKYTGWAMFFLAQWMDFYPWYTLTISGAFIGLLYGFVYGFISLFLLGWIYNLFNP